MDDRSLLERFIAERSEEAFAELVRRHVDLVYSAARRQIRDQAMVDDVAQAVFVLLAGRARTIREGEALAGWLLVTTRSVAMNALRSEMRRRHYEREAAAMKREMQTEALPEWNSIAPLVDEAVANLKRDDRDAITLRYFKGQSLGEVAGALGVSEQAAQKRVGRAVEKLRKFFARRGVETSPDGLASVLAINLLVKAPLNFSAQVARSALSGGSSMATAKGAALIMATTKTKLAIGVLIAIFLAGAATPIVLYLANSSNQSSSPQAPSQSSSVVNATLTYQPGPMEPGLQAKFNAVYSLAPGQNFKRVMPPFIPERAELERFATGVPLTSPREFGSCVVMWDGKDAHFQEDQLAVMNFGDLLKSLLGIWPQDTDIPRETLIKEVPGDWVIPANWYLEPKLSWDDKLKALLPAIGDVVSPGFVLKQEMVEREVIVVRGKIDYERLKVHPEEKLNVISFVGGDPQQANGHSIAQNAREMLQRLGETTGRPVIVQADLGENQPFDILLEGAEELAHMPEMPDASAVDSILNVVSEQTTLQFTREHQHVMTWRLVKAGD